MGRVIRAQHQGRRLLPATVYDAKQTAASIVERATERAAQLERDALQQGLEQGRAQAREHAARALLDIASARAEAVAEIEASAVQAVSLITKRLVGEAFAADPERIHALVAPLLARVRRARCIVLRVNPEDEPALRARIDEHGKRLDIQGAVELRCDASLQRGGCVVESSLGELDARVETRVDELARALQTDPR